VKEELFLSFSSEFSDLTGFESGDLQDSRVEYSFEIAVSISTWLAVIKGELTIAKGTHSIVFCGLRAL